MSQWEKQVKVSMDDIFGDNDDKEVKDTYSEMSSVEKGNVYDIIYDEEYLEDLDKYYSTGEQMDLASEGIHLTVAKKYHLETGKKPIWKKRVTNKFRDWLKINFPDLVELLTDDKKSEKSKEKTHIKGHEIKEKIKDFQASEIIEEKLLTTYEHALTWLYDYMENLDFGDFIPSDEDIKKIEKINELIK